MSFDISDSIGQMAGAMEQSVGKDASEFASYAVEVLSKQQEALAELAEARLEGELDQDEFEEELQREMLIVESEMLAANVIAKAAVQKAIQAAIKVLTKAVMPL